MYEKLYQTDTLFKTIEYMRKHRPIKGKKKLKYSLIRINTRQIISPK